MNAAMPPSRRTIGVPSADSGTSPPMSRNATNARPATAMIDATYADAARKAAGSCQRFSTSFVVIFALIIVFSQLDRGGGRQMRLLAPDAAWPTDCERYPPGGRRLPAGSAL